MRLKLNLDGLDFELKIEGYKPCEEINDIDCNVSFHLKYCNNIVDYKVTNKEILTATEIDFLRDFLQLFLDDQMQIDTFYQSSHYDFEFLFYPQREKDADDNDLEEDPEDNLLDLTLELRTHLWDDNDVLTSTCITGFFDRTETEYFYYYLRLITNELTTNDEKIKEMINNGSLIED